MTKDEGWRPGNPPPYYTRQKLTPQQREEIRDRRAATGESAADLAREFGVSVSTIRRIGW